MAPPQKNTYYPYLRKKNAGGAIHQKRKEKAGNDPVKEKLFSDYRKKNKGAKHPQDRPKISNPNFTIE